MAKVNFDTDNIIRHYQTELEKAMKKAVLMIEADAKKNCPVDQGRLRASITNVVDKIASDVIRGRVGTNVKYAPYVEYGTEPHPVSPEALAGWAKRHGMEGAEFAISKKIMTKGTDPQPYLRPALEKNFDKVLKMLRRAI